MAQVNKNTSNTNTSAAAALLAACETPSAVLALVAAGTVDTASGLARITALMENQRAAQPLRFKISEKGALSVYGLSNKWPTTLYRSQWERLLSEDNVKRLKQFIVDNGEALSTKEKAAGADK